MSTGATGGPADHDGERLLAVDIGGTKMAAAIVTADGTILDRRQRPTVGHDSADAMFARARGCVGRPGLALDAGSRGRRRQWWADDHGWRTGLTGQHPGLARLSLCGLGWPS